MSKNKKISYSKALNCCLENKIKIQAFADQQHHQGSNIFTHAAEGQHEQIII